MFWIIPALLNLAMRPRSNTPFPEQKHGSCRNCKKNRPLGNFGFCSECFEIVNVLDDKWQK